MGGRCHNYAYQSKARRGPNDSHTGSVYIPPIFVYKETLSLVHTYGSRFLLKLTEARTDMTQVEKDVVTYDCWGLTTSATIQTFRERTQKWKPSLLRMAQHVHDTLKMLKPNDGLRAVWYISDGTLLGAYRNGKMIEHDYDFDYGLCFLHEDGAVANLEECKKELQRVAKHLSESVDKRYTIKHRTDYAYKIELYEESSGIHHSDNGDWYNVHLDIQGCYSPDQKKYCYAYFREDMGDAIVIDTSSVLPLGEIQFESLTFPCPKDVKTFLTAIYGYLGSPAKFNKDTNKYEPIDA